MIPDAIICKACESSLPNGQMESYSFCPLCGSANYISENSAADDNNVYFNAIYSHTDLHIIDERKRLFELFSRLDSKLHFREVERFHHLTMKFQSIITSQKSVEVGFGCGDELIKHLRSGADIYGLDISSEAVKNFKLKYPEYAARAACSASFHFAVDAVYSNALFEHLDNPGDFLANAFAMLKPGGQLCMRLPIITGKAGTDQDAAADINFWKPCHRILYTLKGLNVLFARHGFMVRETAALAYYGYKVMNRMLKLNYKDIAYSRTPYAHLKGLTDLTFKKILLQSFFEKNICSDFALIAAKIH